MMMYFTLYGAKIIEDGGNTNRTGERGIGMGAKAVGWRPICWPYVIA